MKWHDRKTFESPENRSETGDGKEIRDKISRQYSQLFMYHDISMRSKHVLHAEYMAALISQSGDYIGNYRGRGCPRK